MTEKKLKKTEQALEMEQAKSRLLMALSRCIGKGKALGMGEAYQKAFLKDWSNRISDTRKVRTLITRLRRGDEETPPVAICSSCCNIRPGYYFPVGQELEEYIDRVEKQALKKLAMAAGLRKKNLPEHLGQLALALRGRGC